MVDALAEQFAALKRDSRIERIVVTIYRDDGGKCETEANATGETVEDVAGAAKVKRDTLEPNRYEYLSKYLSDLYDRADSLSREEAIAELKKMIERDQEHTRGAQRASSY